MSIPVIKHYYDDLEKVIQFGGTKKETAIRTAFYILLNEYARTKGLMVVPEITIKSLKGTNVTPDGTLKDALRQDIGYWESKDEEDDLQEEIKRKFSKGYPKDNILFEDSKIAILYQNGQKVLEINMEVPEELDKIVKQFINFEKEEVLQFRDAIEHFKEDIPKVTNSLRKLIQENEKGNPKFIQARSRFLEILRESINPNISHLDTNEMMIQHILTADIFMTIFEEAQYHRENNIAKELEKVLDTFFTGTVRRATIESVKHYYQTIKVNAASIADHHEKQKFLKVVYEAFYKSYNPKAADRLGVVYTPNEIVKFMIDGTNYLLYEYFEKNLEDEGVEILDPCTGTGTFICDIIDAISKNKLQYKYQNELHANEVAILPYYIANLNIEYTYRQKMGSYLEFNNICFVDTIDNMGFSRKGQGELFGVSAENAERIKKQNKKKISVIIGNPPYNSNQQSENENNKNRSYSVIDERIKETFLKKSTAQKTKVYDMYARFYRWAMDRIGNDGIITFVTNRSFLEAKGFDGFRKNLQEEFQYAFIIDLGGNIRENYGKKGVSIGNVFNIQTGVCITFLVKRKKQIHKAVQEKHSCKIHYYCIEDKLDRESKLFWLSTSLLENLDFETIKPDKNYNWLNIADNDWDKLLPLCDKKNKLDSDNKTVFHLYSNGLVSNRDEWVYDYSKENLIHKMEFFYKEYNHEVKRWIQYKKKNEYVDRPSDSNPVVDQFTAERNVIKWSGRLKRDKLRKEKIEKFDKQDIIECLYRPYIKKFLCDSYLSIDVRGSLVYFFHTPNQQKVYRNKIILFPGSSSVKPFQSIATYYLPCLDLLEKTQGCAFYIYDSDSLKDNITDWALEQFHKKYENKKDSKSEKPITKEDVFHYVYAVLHNPTYRKKYELNLKRDFPRIPFYKDFWKWTNWGKELMELHIGYETVEPYSLVVTVDQTSRLKQNDDDHNQDGRATTYLRADKENDKILIDSTTTIVGIPPEAWKYQLGNRSALEWILDQYKESKPSDKTIAENFDTYRFADYKEQVIDLIKRVCTVSIETIRIQKEMEDL